jgi:energy-coupling factor transporter ATP-binding protein EcfA2
MQLTKVNIRNYRSIQELDVTLDPKCRILVGINESGKTNILDALNLLNPENMPSRRDIREPGLNEPQIAAAYVRFIFDFTESELAEITENVKSRVLSQRYDVPFVELKGSALTIEELCRSRQGVYVVDIPTAKNYALTWSLGAPVIASNWHTIAPTVPAEIYAVFNGAQVPLKHFALVNRLDFPDIPNEYLAEPSASDLQALITAPIKKIVGDNLLTVLLWNYDESKLLPSKINLEQFCAKPESCIPLKRMFQLYGTTDIKTAVAEAKAGSTNALPNLLRRVAAKTTKHFHDTWREYDGIKFSLGVDGTDLVARIEDKSNHYALSQRSDGFKRFVTFLLMVSAEDASNQLKDTVLLIDEPEIGLHPSGARYLMQELIKISKNNYVLFSTHSIFMIDSRVIARHLIVKKKNEITQVEEVSDSNIQDEEVIYKSLGYSIFANLKDKNLIFEGWNDKRLFEVAISRVPSGHDELKQLKSLGRCFVQGVKQIKNVTPLFEAGDRKCLILSDNDAIAREQQKDYQQGRGFGAWKRYDELLGGTAAVTGEDFIKDLAFRNAIDAVRHKHNIPALPMTEFSKTGGKLNSFRQWLLSNGVEQADVARALREIKESVFDDLKPSEIAPEYYDYLEAVSLAVAQL